MGMIAAVATSKTDWYLMRGSGLVTFVLLTLTVVLGVAGQKGLKSRLVPAAVTAGVHKTVALLAASFLALHVVTAVLDSWIGISWLNVVVPFGAGYRPMFVGLGALSLDLIGAVIITSLLRARLGYRTWRLVHWLTWASWPVAYLHSIGTGTDATHGFGLAVTSACAIAFVAAAAWRFAPGATEQPSTPAVPASGRVALSRAAFQPAPAHAPDAVGAARQG